MCVSSFDSSLITAFVNRRKTSCSRDSLLRDLVWLRRRRRGASSRAKKFPADSQSARRRSFEMYRRLMTREVGIYCRTENCDRRCGLFHVRSAGPPPNRKVQKRSVNGQSQVASSYSLDTDWKRSSMQPSPSSTEKSYVTLEEIMESARRKISQDIEAPMPPSPEVADIAVPSSFQLTPRVAKKRSTSKKPTNRPPEELYNPFDSDSDEGGFVSAEPPTQIDDDDFDGLLKAAAPPADAYSNPLYKTSDPLVSHMRRYSVGDDQYSVDFSNVDLSRSSRMSIGSDEEDHTFNFLRHKLSDQLTNGAAVYESEL
ncbi:hypothetical protein QR680_016647 [Steinernema hermaphroditum]|uniref:Uncharacterized protein n=1 Tax=Steinernema hermaphroditum TaxID=289476 RepID=A0AA39HCU7_9BILA|nr:hypothetical protein QR680_016647 [Steinernema hermaphroditum]